jgi:hypothetical protein
MSNEKTITTANPKTSLNDLAARITAREKEIDLVCDSAVATIVSALGLAFEQGDDLAEAKAACRHGDWELWLSSNFPKGQETARRYMKLAETPKDYRREVFFNCKSMTYAYKTLGILPTEAVTGASGGGSISIPPVIQRLTWIAEWTGRNLDDIGTWEQPRREELKLKLKPIVAIYEKL